MKLRFNINNLLPGGEMYDIIGDKIIYYHKGMDGSIVKVETQTVEQAQKIINIYDLTLALDKLN